MKIKIWLVILVLLFVVLAADVYAATMTRRVNLNPFPLFGENTAVMLLGRETAIPGGSAEVDLHRVTLNPLANAESALEYVSNPSLDNRADLLSTEFSVSIVLENGAANKMHLLKLRAVNLFEYG